MCIDLQLYIKIDGSRIHFNFIFSQYVTQTVEVESPSTVRQLTETRQKNEQLKHRLSSQKERCKQLEEKIRLSDEVSCNLQHKVILALESKIWIEFDIKGPSEVEIILVIFAHEIYSYLINAKNNGSCAGQWSHCNGV